MDEVHAAFDAAQKPLDDAGGRRDKRCRSHRARVACGDCARRPCSTARPTTAAPPPPAPNGPADAAPGPAGPPRHRRRPTRSQRRPEPVPTRPRRRRPTRMRPNPRASTTRSAGSAYVIPAGWVESDATHLDYGSALLSKTPGRRARVSRRRLPTTPASCSANWTRSCTPALNPTTPRPRRGWRPTWASSSCRIPAPGSTRRPLR